MIPRQKRRLSATLSRGYNDETDNIYIRYGILLWVEWCLFLDIFDLIGTGIALCQLPNSESYMKITRQMFKKSSPSLFWVIKNILITKPIK